MTAADVQLQEGVRLYQAGRLAEAEAIYRSILAWEPDHSETLRAMGILAQQVGRTEIALDLFRRCVALNPASAIAYNHLGSVLGSIGRMREALAALETAASLDSANGQIQYNLGTARLGAGQAQAAAEAFRKAARLRPNSLETWNNLGVALLQLHRFDEAIEASQTALRLDSRYFEAWCNLGNALRGKGRLNEAIDAYRRAVELWPGSVELCNNLGAALLTVRQIDAAAHWCRRALQLDPDCAVAHANLGNCLKDQGQIEAAIPAFRRAIVLAPESPGLHGNLVYALNFDPRSDPASLRSEQSRWNERHGCPVQLESAPFADGGSRRLRIGYVSPNFCDHVIGRNILPLLRERDLGFAEVICYSGVVQPDFLTAQYRSLSDGWRDIAALDDGAAAELIRRDRIDILVDLSLHLAGNRLPLFARKPAPVQASFAGYPGSTGLNAIDYRLTDPWLEPLGVAEVAGSEIPIRLPHSFWCYDPATMTAGFTDECPVAELPALNNGFVTFGFLGNFSKINRFVLGLWAEVLRAVKGARLLLRAPEGFARETALAFLRDQGIEGRVEFVGHCRREEYLRQYSKVDIDLDPFPYNGHTTSLDALWMGAPVVSLAGSTPVGRAGLSQLTNLGLRELCAASADAYVQIAVSLAGDLARLAALRGGLRERMRTSPLTDAVGFARGVEAAFRQMASGTAVRLN